jgi:hypothetical protein
MLPVVVALLKRKSLLPHPANSAEGKLKSLVRINEDGPVEPITLQPHEREFRQMMKNLAPVDFQRISDTLNEHINTTGRSEIITSSWIPGADWTGTPYEPIYFAAGQNCQLARFFCGLILWRVMMDRPEVWSLGRYPKNSGETTGLTYFRLHLSSANAV